MVEGGVGDLGPSGRADSCAVIDKCVECFHWQAVFLHESDPVANPDFSCDRFHVGESDVCLLTSLYDGVDQLDFIQSINK